MTESSHPEPSKSHLVGGVVSAENRYLRQLCQWCGHRLIDEDLNNVMVPEGSGPFPTWEVGVWLRIDGRLRSVVQTEDGKMPPDACMRDVSPLLRSVPTKGARVTE